MKVFSDAFAQNYASMRDDELQRLSLDVGNLVPQAREALRAEMERRHFQIGEINWSARPAQPPPPELAKTKKSNGASDTFVVFLICNIAFCALFATLLSLVKGVDMKKLGEGMTQFVLYNTLALTVITTRFVASRKLKTVWIIGIVEPVCLVLLLVVVSLFR